METTEAMVGAALDDWFGSEFWRDAPDADSNRVRMRFALDAALDAAPGGHGERG